MDTKKVIAVGLGALVVGMAAGAVVFPVHDVQVEYKNVIVEVPVVETVTEVQTVEVPVNVTVEKIVEVDNGNLDLCVSFVQDNVDEDIDADDIYFEANAKIEAEAFVRDNMVSLLNDNDFFDDGEVLDAYRKSEVSIKKIQDAVVLDNDFENEDLLLQYEVKVRAKEGSEDAEYFVFNVEVPFEDGKLIDEDITVELI